MTATKVHNYFDENKGPFYARLRTESEQRQAAEEIAQEIAEKVDGHYAKPLRDVVCSETLTPEQYRDIMNVIWRDHRFGGLSGLDKRPCRHVKYVRPNWDMRDGRCFAISFDRVTFDFRGSVDSMYDRIMAWLNGKEAVTGGI